jgi:prevent-host-death family protein
MAVSYNVYEAKTHLSQLLDRAAAGEEIVIARAGRPVARLVALAGPASRGRKPGAWRGKVTMTQDFDALPAEIDAAFRGETA